MFVPWYYCFGFCTPVTGMMVWFIVLVMGFPMVQISIFGNTIVGIWRILPILYCKNCICLGFVFWMRVYVVGTRDWLDTSTVIRHDMFGRCGLRWPPRGLCAYGSRSVRHMSRHVKWRTPVFSPLFHVAQPYLWTIHHCRMSSRGLRLPPCGDPWKEGL